MASKKLKSTRRFVRFNLVPQTILEETDDEEETGTSPFQHVGFPRVSPSGHSHVDILPDS